MEKNILKKFINTGVGFVSLTAERMSQTIEGLISDGKISEEEGRKIIDDFTKNTETKRDELEGQFKSIVEKILKSFSFATSTEVDKIENRIAVLEALLAEKEAKEETKPAAKKTTTKKPATKKPAVKKEEDTKKEDDKK